MRVYEIAKILNVSNRDVIDFLMQKGFSIKSHMSALPQEALDLAERHFKVEEDEAIDTKTIEKKQEQEKKVVPSTESLAVKKHVVKTEKIEKKNNIEKLNDPSVLKLKSMTVLGLAQALDKPVTEIILTMLRKGVACTINQVLSEDQVRELAELHGFSIETSQKNTEEAMGLYAKKAGGVHERLPVVVVLGHVDHGKTTLLDYIRKTRIAAREKGGITQHLGAYQAKTEHGNIVFLDTPGHEAFSNIRGRGVHVADIAILVIAADDGVMPQTVEAIKKIKQAEIPVIVAVNKMDRVDKGRIEAVKTDLARYELLPEEWGGDVVCVPISAKNGMGVDALLEMVVLQSQMMDLRTDTEKIAQGFVLESKIEKGLGPIATIMCQQGKLRIGDFFAAGKTHGKITSMVNSYGERINQVGPSEPVQIAGFDELPIAGDHFEVISKEKYKILKGAKSRNIAQVNHVINEHALKLIVKADSTSSLEALLSSLHKIANKNEGKIHIIFSGVGNINESDVMLAANTDAIVVGLHVKAESGTQDQAQKNIISLFLFDIIYKLLEHIENLIEQAKPKEYVLKKIGEAIVRKVFDIKNIGVIAGAYCKDGRFSREGTIVGFRGKEKIGSGSIKSLERDRKPVKEVHAGFEFAFLVEGFNDWQIDDKVECYLKVLADQ